MNLTKITISMSITKSATTKVAAVATGLTMAVSMLAAAPVAHAAALTTAQIDAIVSLLQSFGADAATIANVQASLTGGTPTAPSGGGTSACSFTRDLTLGASGADVTCLQNALIAAGYGIPAISSGVAAPGYFGSQTQTAVVAWQKASGVSPAAGYFGPISRSSWNLAGGTTGAPGTPSAPGAPITGNGLKVMLASDSPSGAALVQAQAIGTLAKFTFQNPTGAEIKVTSLSFMRIGVSNDSTLSNVYLYEGAKRLTDSAGVSNSAFNFNDAAGIFTLPAGGSKTVAVLSDIAGSTSGQQVGAQLTAVASSGTLDSSVALPISGGLQTVSAATLATADWGGTTLPSGSSVNPQDDYTVWQNTGTISTRAVNLTSFQLRNIGSIDRGAITNFRLYADGVQIGSTVQDIASDDTITFDLSAAPVRLETGGRVIKVVGNIVGGSNDTFQMSLRRASDAMFVDTDLNQPILSTAAGSTFSARNATSATIGAASVSVVKATNSPSSNVSLNATSVKWATYEMRASGENVKIESLNVNANTSSDRGLDNGKVFFNGVQVGSTKDLTDATDIEFTFGSSFILKAGEVAIVDIYADAKSTSGASFTTSETAQITLDDGSSNGQGVVSLSSVNVPGSDVAANSITISSQTVTMSMASDYGSQTILAGATNARVGSFTLAVGATEGVNVNTITVTLSSDESASITDLRLVDRGTGAQIGTTKTAPSTGNSFSTNFDMPSSGTKTVDVYANVKSGSNIGEWIAAIDGTSTGSLTGTSVSFGNSTTGTLQTITVAASGTLNVAIGTSPLDRIVIAGSSDVKVGSFRFSTQNSSFTLQEIKVKLPIPAATAVSAVTLKYPDVNGVTQSAVQAIALASGSSQTQSTATFTGLAFYIPAGGEKSLDVYVNVATLANMATTSGASITVTIDDDEGFKAIDSAGNVDSDLGAADLDSNDTSGRGTLVVRKSVPVFSAPNPVSGTLSEGTGRALGRVTLSADAAGDVSWAKMQFTLNKTAALTLGATTTVAVWNSASQITGTIGTSTLSSVALTQTCAVAGETTCVITFLPTTEQTILAGQSETYELRGTVGGTAAGNNSIDVSIQRPSTTVSTGTFSQIGNTAATTTSFVWSDRSAWGVTHGTGSPDWSNEYLIRSGNYATGATLPITIGTQSVSINT